MTPPSPPPNAPVCCLTLIRANKTEEMSLLAARVRVLGALFGYNLLAHCQDIKSCPRQAGRWLVSLSVCVRPAPCPHSPCWSDSLRVHTPRVGQTVSTVLDIRPVSHCRTVFSVQCSVFSVVITGLQVGGRWNFGVIWDKSLVNLEKFSKEGCQRHIFFVCERYRVL